MLTSQQDQLTLDEKLSIEFSICKSQIDELKNNLVNYELIKIVEIKNCPTTLEASKLISNSNFRSSLEQLKSFTTLILKINEELNEKYAEKPKTHEFNIERNFLISYESNETVNEKIIYWKNGKEGNYLTTNLMKEYSAELTDFVRDFLIDNVNMNYDNSINENHELANLNDSNNSNLLMKAVESEQTAIIDELLNLPFDINQKSNEGKTAADIAYEKRNNQILLQLLEEDSTFPNNFSIAQLETDEASKEIEEIFNDSRNLHDAIALNDLKKVKEILDENSNLIYFYNSSNVSAATAAIKANKIEIYRTLLANDCSIGPEEDFNRIMNELYDKNDTYEPERKRMKGGLLTTHDYASQPLPEKHLLMLCANSQACHDDQRVKNRLKQIKEAYKNLNEIPIVRQILQLISMHSNFKIYFDFNRSSVEFMNPFNGNSYTRGLCENVEIKKFYVYIAAKELLLNDGTALGTLAHELCHFAINLTFCNDAKPYAIDDEENKVKFDEIIKKCNVIPLEILNCTQEIEKFQNQISFLEYLLQKSSDELDETIISYEMRINKNQDLICEDSKKIEVIEEQIAGIKVHNSKLNNYIEEIKEKLDSDIENEIIQRIIKRYQKRIMLNEWTLMSKINKNKKLNEQIIDSEKEIEEFNEELRLCKSNHQASITEYENKISKLENEIKSVKGRCDHEEIVSLVFNYEQSEWTSELIVRVPHMICHYQNDSKRLNELKVTFKDLFDYYNDVVAPKMNQTQNMLDKLFNNSNDIEFSDLTDAYKAKIHHSNINFQGVEVKFKEIIEDKNSEIFQHLNSDQIRENLIKNKSLKFGSAQQIKTKFYIERDFIDYDITVDKIWNNKLKREIWSKKVLNNLKKFDEISSIANETKMILLSDRAGAGKTTTFKHLSVKLKSKFPHYWISYIDLKRHLRVYEKFERNFQVSEILLEILPITDELEIEIFTKLFVTDKVILLYDGVDEIAPKFKDFFMKFIESVRNLTKIHQWISTRPQHMQELKDKFNQKAYKLLPYNKSMKIELVENVFKNLKVENVDANDILLDINLMTSYKTDTDSPMMLQMMTELYANDKTLFYSSNKLFSLYDKMIEFKKRILGDKGEVVNEDRDNQRAKLTVWQIHQIYALKLLYNDDKTTNINELQLLKRWKKEKSKWTPEAISRYGFLYVDNWNTIDEFPDFVHRTFAEYFVAQFIIQDLYDLDEDDDDDEMSEKEIEMRFKLLMDLEDRHDITKFILSFIEIHGSKKMHKHFFKLITSNEMQKLLISTHELLKHYMIKIFTIDESFLKEFKFNGNLTIFQCSINDYDLNVIKEIVDIYKCCLGTDWINHTGYTVKENFTMPNIEEIDEILILNLFDQLEIPQNDLFKFFGNNFYSLCKKTFRNSVWRRKLMKFIKNNFHNCKNEFLKTIIKKIRYEPNSYNDIINNAENFLSKFENFLDSDDQISGDEIKDFFTKLILSLCGLKKMIRVYREKKFTKNDIQQIFIKHSLNIIYDITINKFVSIEDFIIFFKEIFNAQSEMDQLKKFLKIRSENEIESFKNHTVLSYLNKEIVDNRAKNFFDYINNCELLQRTLLDLAKQIEIPDDEIKKLSIRLEIN